MGDEPEISQITDSVGRTISFNYPDSNTVEISLPAFGSSEAYNPNATITYTLTLSSRQIKDPCSGGPNCTSDDYPYGRWEGAYVLRFIDIDFSYGSENYSYRSEFEYHDMGEMWKRTLPYETGETPVWIEYTYAIYTLGDISCNDGCTKHSEIYKKTFDYNGETYTWFMNRYRENNTDDPPQNNVEVQYSNPPSVYVWDPYQNLTLYNFSFSTDDEIGYCYEFCILGTACPTQWDHGLNTSILYFAGDEVSQDNLIRKIEYEYDLDRDASGNEEYFHYGECTQESEAYRLGKNIRLKKKKVIYYDDEKGPENHDTYTVEYKDWDGYGHYREAWEYENSNLYRIAKTNYNPTLDPQNPNGLFNNWIINTYDYKLTQNASGEELSRSDYFFCEEQNCGTQQNILGKLMKRIDRIAPNTTSVGAEAQDGDVNNKYTYDSSSGNLAKEEIESKVDSTTYSYSYDYTYAAGGYTETKKISNSDWYLFDRDIDLNTGLDFQSRGRAHDSQSCNISTLYDYDPLRRLTEIDPYGTEKPTIISYPSLRETTVKQGTGDDYIYTKYIYDDLFRLKEIQKRNYDGYTSIQRTEYDILGNQLRTSEWAPINYQTLYFTTYDYTSLEYPNPNDPDEMLSFPDPFYRIRKIETPDEKITEYEYKGLETSVTTLGIMGLNEQLIDSTTTFTDDLFGRLVNVDSPEGGANVHYLYDEEDNLLQVEMGDQTRYFVYDPLSKLIMESNPENGTTHYEAYDPIGNLLQKKDARQNTFKYSYDAEGRLTEVGLGTQGETLLSHYDYDDASEPGFDPECSDGKIVQIKSYFENAEDEDDNGTVDYLQLTERYSYNGLNGRLGEKTFIFNLWDEDGDATNEQLTMTYSYNDFGLPEALSYPILVDSDRLSTELNYSYKNGYLVDVYDPNRKMNYVRNMHYNYASGVKDIFYHDQTLTRIEPDVRYRPERVKVTQWHWEPNDPIIPVLGCQWGHDLQYCGQDNSGGSSEETIWDSGLYEYDGAGNINKIGANKYRYDQLSRLVYAHVDSGINNDYYLSYTYDQYGNMTDRSKQFNTQDPVLQTFYMENASTGQVNNRIQSYQVGNDIYDYVYDENGNVIQDERYVYTYDARNRLTEIAELEGSLISKYFYDSNGYRIRAKDQDTIRYFFRDDSGRVLTEYKESRNDSTGKVWDKDYVYAAGFNIALIKNSKPAAPTNLYVDNVDTFYKTLELHWEKVPEDDINMYIIERTYDQDGTINAIEIEVDSNHDSTQDSFPNANEQTIIKYKIKAKDTAILESEWSEQIVVRPLSDDPPADPTNVSATGGDRKATVTWNASASDDVFGYNVYRKKAGQNSVQVNTHLIKSLLFVDTDDPDNPNGPGLINGESYYYSVSAVDTIGLESDHNNEIQDPAVPQDNIPPSDPLNLEALSGPGAGEITLHWTPNNDADLKGYNLYRKEEGGTFNWSSPVNSSLIVAAYYTDSGIPEGFNYVYVVKAEDDDFNESGPSNEADARPRLATATLPAPTNLDGQYAVNENGTLLDPPFDCEPGRAQDDFVEVQLNWSEVDGASDGYSIYRKKPDEPYFQKIDSTSSQTETSYTDTQIESDSYVYAVSARMGIEESANSAEKEIEEQYGVDDRPMDIQVYTNIDDYGGYNECDANWIDWAKVTKMSLLGYNIYRKCSPTVGGEESWGCEGAWQKINTSTVQMAIFKDKDVGNKNDLDYYKYFVTSVFKDHLESNCSPTAGQAHSNCQDMGCPSGDYYSCPLFEFEPGTESPDDKPAPPRNFRIDYIDTGGNCGIYSYIYWDRNKESDIAFYDMYRSENPGGPYDKINSFPIAKFENSYINYGNCDMDPCTPHPGTGYNERYYYVIKAVDEGGNESDPSREIDNCDLVPGYPENIQAEPGINCGEIIISWEPDGPYGPNANHSQLAGYHIYRNDPPDYTGFNLIASTSDTSYTDAGLSVGFEYFYKVTSYTTRGIESDESNEVCSYPYDTGSCEIIEWDLEDASGIFLASTNTKVGAFKDQLFDAGNTGNFKKELFSKNKGEGDVFNISSSSENYDENLSYMLAEADYQKQIDTYFNSQDSYVRHEYLNIAKFQLSSASYSSSNKPSAKGIVVPDDFVLSPYEKIGTEPNYAFDVYLLHPDHLGSTRIITLGTLREPGDEIGDFVSGHHYLPFGQAIGTQIASANTHRFTGHERDEETDLDYMMARYYRSGIARFLSADPIRNNENRLRKPQLFNLHIYVGNNPLGYIDPEGKYLRSVQFRPGSKVSSSMRAIKILQMVYELDKKIANNQGEHLEFAHKFQQKDKPTDIILDDSIKATIEAGEGEVKWLTNRYEVFLNTGRYEGETLEWILEQKLVHEYTEMGSRTSLSPRYRHDHSVAEQAVKDHVKQKMHEEEQKREGGEESKYSIIGEIIDPKKIKPQYF